MPAERHANAKGHQNCLKAFIIHEATSSKGIMRNLFHWGELPSIAGWYHRSMVDTQSKPNARLGPTTKHPFTMSFVNTIITVSWYLPPVNGLSRKRKVSIFCIGHWKLTLVLLFERSSVYTVPRHHQPHRAHSWIRNGYFCCDIFGYNLTLPGNKLVTRFVGKVRDQISLPYHNQ